MIKKTFLFAFLFVAWVQSTANKMSTIKQRSKEKTTQLQIVKKKNHIAIIVMCQCQSEDLYNAIIRLYLAVLLLALTA